MFWKIVSLSLILKRTKVHWRAYRHTFSMERCLPRHIIERSGVKLLISGHHPNASQRIWLMHKGSQRSYLYIEIIRKRYTRWNDVNLETAVCRISKEKGTMCHEHIIPATQWQKEQGAACKLPRKKRWWVNTHEQIPKARSEAQERKSNSGEQWVLPCALEFRATLHQYGIRFLTLGSYWLVDFKWDTLGCLTWS